LDDASLDRGPYAIAASSSFADFFTSSSIDVTEWLAYVPSLALLLPFTTFTSIAFDVELD